jgi:hypothetical protein
MWVWFETWDGFGKGERENSNFNAMEGGFGTLC